MPIRDLQISLREVGRIRCGDQVKSGRGKAPRKLDRFRFTSDDGELLSLVASSYGGDVEPWPDAPTGEQLQVYITAERIPVMIVPGLRPITQWWEQWTGGGCTMRCDGEREVLSGKPCICKAEQLVGLNRCKPTTRLHVVLPDIPGLGTWRLESHGYYAAVELGGTMALVGKLVAATGDIVHGTLRLTQRSQKVQGQPTRRFAVPTLDVSLTIPELVQQMALGDPVGASIDAANADRVRALAAVHQHPSSGFPSDQEREAAEARGLRKVERKRTPDMGPGRRGKLVQADLSIPDEARTEDVTAAFGSPLSAQQLKALQTLMRMTGMNDRDERLLFTARIIGRSISSSKELTSAEASQVIDVLAAVEQGTAEYVTDADGLIVGAVPVVADGAVDPVHDYSLDPDAKGNDD